MKGIIRLLFWVVALTTFCGTISAQTGKQSLTREQLAEVQAKHIAKEMAMDDAASFNGTSGHSAHVRSNRTTK